jgi:hypothetical protein
MRFKDIKNFNVNELLLDQGNYRFKEASNQIACIEKIYNANQQYFKNLMSSVAEDDLGELLLVYKERSKNIVLDGNRRLAALKVLSDPKKFAPTDSVKQYADDLLKKHKIDFSAIQGQVSSNKQLIFKTVYERHAAGQGKSRINWSAYGAARFRYDQQMEEDKEWYSIAVLLEAERVNPKWTEFIDSSEYSHEVFRRIFKSALDKGVVSRTIFSDRNQRLKTTADKKLIKDATNKVNRFLEAMQNKDLSLSRSGKYADKNSVDAYISQFSLSPDNDRAKPPSSAVSQSSPEQSSTASTYTNNSNSNSSTGNQSSSSNTGSTSGYSRDKQGYGIDVSESISQKLVESKSKKLVGLYKSLCTVSLTQHPQLLYVGAWSFFETLSTLIGKADNISFTSYLGSKLNEPTFGYNKSQRREYTDTLEDISKKGNLNKHSGIYHTAGAEQLRIDFTTLEPFILALLEILISKKRP